MRTRLFNARILSMIESQDIFMGEIHITDSIITYIGRGIDIHTSENRNCLPFDREIDCNGNLLMPGFKNAHAHSGMSVLRSVADDRPLHEWLKHDIFPREAQLTSEDIYWTSQLSVLEYLTSGITACFDMYMYQDTVAKAMDDMGFRCVQAGSGNNFDKDITYINGMYERLNLPGSLQSYQMGFHAEYTTSLDRMQKVAECVQSYKAPLYVHACETEAEVKGCVERYGMTPVAFLDSLGMFDYGGGIYHGVWMSEEDFRVMKEKGLYVVTCPASNAKLASGVCPVAEYRKHGIPIAIGTDGPSSNNCLDFFREMFLVSVLAKLRERDAAFLDAMEVLRMATVNGAHCMHQPDCDVLAMGKKADIIMIDLNMPNMQPINNIAKNIVYSGSKINVRMTMVDGKILYQDGRFFIPRKDVTPELIYKNVESIRNRLMK